MKYYLAGPMTGIPHFNYPLFLSSYEALKAKGYEIQLPDSMHDPEVVERAMASADGKHDSAQTKTWGQLLASDIILIADVCQGIMLLPGWQESRGAKLEAFTGLLCGREFRTYDPVRNQVSAKLSSFEVLGIMFLYMKKRMI